jgi:hypothetical protein
MLAPSAAAVRDRYKNRYRRTNPLKIPLRLEYNTCVGFESAEE